LGWPEDTDNFVKYWGTAEKPNAVQIAGKDNLRQQSAMWQAMLLAAKLPPSRQICINGFITVDNKKMSKSVGNVIDPAEMVSKFGIDGARYLLLSKGSFGEDSDMTWDLMTEKYDADLANGLGNLVSRVVKLCDDTDLLSEIGQAPSDELASTARGRTHEMDMKGALDSIWTVVREANKNIEDKRPWELKKTDMDAFREMMRGLVLDLRSVARALTPFLPRTSEKMIAMLSGGPREMLFARIRSKNTPKDV
jgi:methionyl-tRNA synthetase